ncbi:MAG: serine hydrolase domain-containing protein [Acidimicrobiales bacterium]|nr:serine hydrolase domain-containing protein [Acidimicrobiales bacterium]
MPTDPPIVGTVAPGWESIRDVFIANFAPSEDDAGDLGAGLCVIAGGRTVVDLVGGWRDRAQTRPFTPDTLVNSYSVGKGITAAVALTAVSRGLIDLDAPANRHWTELPQRSTLREHLSHQAGLPALRGDVDPSVPMDWPAMCAALAATEPWWEPGTAHGYHTNTAGFLVGEPLRRAAGAARFGDLLAEWFAAPLAADLVYGVPARDLARCSELGLAFGSAPPAPKTAVEFSDELARMRHHAYFNPSTVSGMGVVETREWRQAEVPSTNLHATAAAVATVYRSLLDPSGPVDRAVLAEACTTQVDGPDLILEKRSRFGLGFQLHQPERPIGVTEESFGHFGFGGSLGFADVGADIAVGYVLNRPGDRWQIPRTKRLLAALREAVGASS